MKKLLPFALLLLLFAACKKDGANPYHVIDPVISFNYTNDARQLLFRMLENGTVTTDKDKPEFNQNELNKILQSIQAVYSLNTRQTDSIFNISKVHIYPHVSLNSIILQVNQTSAEGKKLMAQQPSGNATFDALMAKYQFIFNGTVNTSNAGFVTLLAGQSYNITPLLTLFKNYPFIVNAQQNGYVGDGNDITYTLTSNNGVDIDFAVKSGDCPAGCAIRHGWRYHVNFSNYKVTYNGSY